MSRTQMQQAQQLIKQKRYDEARRILQKIDTPTAREWLAKLDQRALRRQIAVPGVLAGSFAVLQLPADHRDQRRCDHRLLAG